MRRSVVPSQPAMHRLGILVTCTVGPLLSGQPRDFGNWALNRGWPLNRGTIWFGRQMI